MEYFSGFFLRAGSVKNDVDIADFYVKMKVRRTFEPLAPRSTCWHTMEFINWFFWPYQFHSFYAGYPKKPYKGSRLVLFSLADSCPIFCLILFLLNFLSDFSSDFFCPFFCPISCLSDCRMSYVWCPMSDTWCPIFDVRCPMSDVRCLMSDLQCLMSGDWCRMSDFWCLMSDVRFFCPISFPISCPIFRPIFFSDVLSEFFVRFPSLKIVKNTPLRVVCWTLFYCV